MASGNGIAWYWSAAAAILAGAVSNHSLRADETWEFTVRVTASVQESPPQITLNWVQDTIATPASYTVYRKAPGDTFWGPGVVLSGDTTSYIDSDVVIGATYEYQVFKDAWTYVGYGYLYSGIDVPLVESRGKVLLIVDSSVSGSLANELARLEQDLIGDGWTVVRHDVSRSDSVTDVKGVIEGEYWADPANVVCVFLFGHVPVPYSGDISPDEHSPDHQGAWPADVYYGVMSGSAWSDWSVYDTGATDPRNWNVPGDGKFDPSAIPANVDLMVGRVDLANMPGQQGYNGPSTFPGEVELLRQYLNKDHNYRLKLFDLPRRALVYDGFGSYGGYAFAASAWRNYVPYFGPENVDLLPNPGTFIPYLSQNAYLCAYACGPGADFSTIAGIGNADANGDGDTVELVQSDIKAVFTMIFASWMGDWDTQDNLQRAVLATPDYGLACCWSGSPHWFLQSMALGETIGYGARLTQNNGPDGLYQSQTNTYAGLVHIALMGDPTLRLHVVAPAPALTATTNSSGVQLFWSAAQDTVLGYYIYRATNPSGPYVRLNAQIDTGTFFSDANTSGQTFTYMVRAVKLETTPSGSYFNASQGSFVTVTAPAAQPVTPPMLSIALEPGGIALHWSTQPGHVYDVLWSADLSSSSWTRLNLNLAAGGTSLDWVDSNWPAAAERFYRILLVQ